MGVQVSLGALLNIISTVSVVMDHIAIYKTITSLLSPVWKMIGLWRRKIGKEDPLLLPQRFGIITHKRPNAPLIWFHGASVGESRAALSIINQILEDWPDLWVLLTSQTVGAIRALSNSLPDRVIHQMAPYDAPRYVNRFLDHWRPKAFCVLEAETWPCAWHSLNQRNVPMFLFNFHISAKSFDRWMKCKSFFEKNYSLFRERWTGCSESFKRFGQLTSLSMTLMPSIKYSAPCLITRVANKEQLNLGGRPFWLASCVHAAEEDLILSVHARLQKIIPNLLLIYVPRHLNRVGILEETHKNIQRRSDIFQPQSSSSIYIMDTMGELGMLYQMASFVVLCGSFCDVGGHNLIEPALLNCAVIHGPDMRNQHDVANHFQQNQAAVKVRAEDLYEAVLQWILHPEQAKIMATRAYAILKQSQIEATSVIKNFSHNLIQHIPELAQSYKLCNSN
jgi:3-deoxy-D-manno-octulosonic-acid transferase